MNQPLGQITVTTPGTPVAIASLLPDPTKPVACHGILFEALPDNAGLVYIGTQNMVVANLGVPGAQPYVYAWLPAPVEGTAPSYSVALTIAPNGLKVNDYYIDAEAGGEGVLVTLLIT